MNEESTQGTKKTEGPGTSHATDVCKETCEAETCKKEGRKMSECQRHEDMNRRVANLEGAVKELATKEAFKSLEQSMKDGFLEIREEFKELREAVDKLKMLPAKRWDALIGDIIKQVVAIGAGLLIAWLTFGGK